MTAPATRTATQFGADAASRALWCEKLLLVHRRYSLACRVVAEAESVGLAELVDAARAARTKLDIELFTLARRGGIPVGVNRDELVTHARRYLAAVGR